MRNFPVGEVKPKYSPSLVENIVSSLPNYLSKRAIDVNGPHGSAKLSKKARKNSPQTGSTLTRSQPGEMKCRPYRKRGDQTVLRPLRSSAAEVSADSSRSSPGPSSRAGTSVSPTASSPQAAATLPQTSSSMSLGSESTGLIGSPSSQLDVELTAIVCAPRAIEVELGFTKM